MNMTRRDFGLSLGVGALASGFILEGCGANSATVFAQIEAWVAVGEKAFAGIVTLLGPFLPPGAQALIALVNAAFTTLLAAVQEYLNSPAAGQPAILPKIEAALQAIADNIQMFLTALNITGNPIVAVVIGLAQLILATIAGFLNALPVAAGGAKTYRVRSVVTVGGVSAQVIPKRRSLSSFRGAYNSIAESNGHSEIDL